MLSRRGQKKSTQRRATECFVTGTIVGIGTIGFAAKNVSCSTVNSVQPCTYEGLSVYIFIIIIGIVFAVIYFASGIYYLKLKKLEKGGRTYSAYTSSSTRCKTSSRRANNGSRRRSATSRQIRR